MTDQVWYRNTGARFQTPEGRTVESGEVFVPTPRCLAMWRLKLRRVTPPPAPQPRTDGWDLPLPPETYVALFPEGPRASQAAELSRGEDEGHGTD